MNWLAHNPIARMPGPQVPDVDAASVVSDHPYLGRLTHVEQQVFEALSASEQAGFTPAAARQLARLAPSQVRFFADSLVRKRLKEVRKLLPLTAGAFGRWFDQLFERYAAIHGLEMPKPHQQDAIGFAAYLRQAVLSAGREPKWGAELARYEAASLQASEPQRRLTVRLLRCPITLLGQRVVRGQESPRPAGRATLAIWFRLRRTAPLRHLVLSFSILPFLRQLRVFFLGAQGARNALATTLGATRPLFVSKRSQSGQKRDDYADDLRR